MQILIPACHHRLCCSLKYQRDPFFIWHLQWKIRYKTICMTEIFIGLVFKYVFHWHQRYPSSLWHHGEEKKSSVSTLSLLSLQKMKLKNILTLGILAMSSHRLTLTTREVMIQHRRIVFSPGEGLNYLIDRMSGVLNPMSLHHTSAVPLQSYREFRSPGLMQAVFWSIILLVLAQYSHNPNPRMPTPSYHLFHLMLVYAQKFRRVAGRFEFKPVAWWDSAHAVWRGVTPGPKHWQWRCPYQLSCAHLYAFWSPQPSPAFRSLIRGCCWTTVLGTLREEGWVLWNCCDWQNPI